MILIVDMNSKENPFGYDEFVSPILSVADRFGPCKVKHYSAVNPKLMKKSDKIILSGTSLKDEEFLKDLFQFDWIRMTDKPILGICVGMEVIGLIFGSKLENLQEIGMKDIRVLQKNILFKSDFRAYTLHNYSVQPSMDFDILAKSDQSIQAIKHEEKEIYGVMFHPEVRNPDILENFLKT